jgi:subtilisin family serine protease
VLDKHNAGTLPDVICGIDWVTATRTDADPANDILVANMSLGSQNKNADDGNCGRSNKDALHLAICNSVAAGVSYVAGAGNSSSDLKDFEPAAFDELLTATAMADYDGQPGASAPTGCPGLGSDDSFATFSNFATLTADQRHTVAAPGVCVGSTELDGGYAINSGTSFASPFTTGTVAICLASGKKPCAGLTPSQIVQKITADAQAYNLNRRGYGFQGDPLRPVNGAYYGYLIRAGLY